MCEINCSFINLIKKRASSKIDTKDFKAIKTQLLFHMTNFGQPIIRIEDANFENRGELLLTHLHEGIDMQPDFMSETLKNVFKMWKRPVNIATVMDETPQLFRFDGKEYTQHKLSEEPSPNPANQESSSS